MQRPTIPTNIHPSQGNSHEFQNMKQQLMTMLMFKSTTSTNNGDSSSSIMMMIYSFIMITIIEKCFAYLPIILEFLNKFIHKKIENGLSKNLSIGNILSEVKQKVSSVTVSINLTKPDNLGFALLDLVTNSKNTKSVYFANNTFSLNDTTPVLIDEEKQIYSLLVKSETLGENGKIKQVVEIYSYLFTIDLLRKYLNDISYLYAIKIQNKMGDKTFYFNALSIPVYRNPDNTKDYSKSPPFFSFTMKQFQTNRKFTNVVGRESELIKKRVNFFLKNEKWYNEKGVPYTLGLLLSGSPGTGKTSTIKCLANETQRHIINIHFNDDITKAQMENLFFSETIQVTSTIGKIEQFVIPIDKRIYVFEDIDCQNDIVLDRGNTTDNHNNDLLSNGVLSNGEHRLCNKLTNGIKPSNAFQPNAEVQMFNIVTQPGKPTGNSMTNPSVNSEKMTLSTLLNLLDGILETPGRIIIMTSNYPKRLDKALIRPGRIDLITEFTLCTGVMICEFVEKFYDVVLSEVEKNKIAEIPEYIWSPAEMNKIMFEHFEDYRQTLRVLYKRIPLPKISDNDHFLDSDSDFSLNVDHSVE